MTGDGISQPQQPKESLTLFEALAKNVTGITWATGVVVLADLGLHPDMQRDELAEALASWREQKKLVAEFEAAAADPQQIEADDEVALDLVGQWLGITDLQRRLTVAKRVELCCEQSPEGRVRAGKTQFFTAGGLLEWLIEVRP